MNVKYSLSQYIIATLAAGAVLVIPTACNDDLGYQNVGGQQIGFKLTAPDTWHEGMPINENAPTTHCTSVRALSGGDTKLYLHTVVADNPAEEKAAVTRGTPVKGTAAFQERYKRFSLSGICYTGEYPDEEAGAQNDWTTEYAYNLYYNTTTGKAEKKSDELFWPVNGQVRFFAFAPTVEDFNGLGTDGTLELSEATEKGSPTLTYTVPVDVTKQVDLMTVCNPVKAATTPEVELNFGHALTAVQIKCGKGMLAGKITKVTIAGIYGKGKQVIGSKTWTPLDEHQAAYTISNEITLSPSTDEDIADKIHVPENTPIAGTDDDNLTFMLLPQTLPEGATMTIIFTDDATKTERTLTGSLAGQIWEAGKIVTYSVSPSSIHISAKVEFNKKGITADNPTGDTIPYSGVWYDAAYTAKAEVTQEGVDTKTIDIPADKVKFQYRLKDSDPWADCTSDANGLLTIAAQPAYATMSNGFDKKTENGSEDNPYSLPSEYYGETANCYLVDKAGYYSLPLVYGNKHLTLPAENPDGFKYFPKHDDAEIPTDGEIAGVEDAVLCWQDAPDLIDPDSVKVVGKNLVFRIHKQTLAQGNALLAVRGTDPETNKKIILWSWHIWVTPYKSQFYSEFYNSVTDAKPAGYAMAKYNLGWCDPHPETDTERTFSLQAVVDMSAYGGGTTETVNIGTFTQMEFKGSEGGDNTYYQWGRKDPMLGGIYNSNTPKYKYHKKGNYSSWDEVEFTMENKQVFNQYNQDGYNYSFCKNLGDKIDIDDYASNGVSIGYAIKHPYMFVTNSRCSDSSGETTDFNYRNHWHKPYKHYPAPYLHDNSHVLFNAWDAGATSAGVKAANVQKTIYDPCPPQFKVPPFDAIEGIITAWNKGTKSVSNNAWIITYNGGEITFPATGVRNYALRNNEWGTVVPLGGSSSDADEEFCKAFYKTSMPAFRMLTFLSSATIEEKKVNNTTDTYNAYQVRIIHIGLSTRGGAFSTTNTTVSETPSSNSYGLTVRPVHTNKKY